MNDDYERTNRKPTRTAATAWTGWQKAVANAGQETARPWVGYIGTGAADATVFAAHGASLFVAMFILLCLMICRAALRSEFWGSIAAATILTIFTTSVFGGHLPITAIAALLNSILFLIVLVRYGVFAVLADMTCRLVLDWSPLTLDSRNWYFESGMAAVALIMVGSLVGFYLASASSRNSKRWARDRIHGAAKLSRPIQIQSLCLLAHR